MAWRDERSSRDARDEEEVIDLDGVDLKMVCDSVPVLTLEKESLFYENCSWILQSALAASGKADGLYEYCDDRAIISACRGLGLREDEMSVVRLKDPKYRHIKAVGTTGKRSVMLAVVVAVTLSEGYDKSLIDELKAYKLDKAFLDILGQGCKRAKGGEVKTKQERWMVKKEEPASDEEEEESSAEIKKALEEEGVEIDVICRKRVPVVGMTKESPFQENVSWLVQTATDCCGKADSVFEYCNDRDIMAECKMECNLSEQEIGLVRLKDKHQHVKAVGTCGKRSILLAIVVALVLQKEVEPSFLIREVRGYDTKLEGPVRALLKAILLLAGRKQSELDSGSGGGGGGGGGGRWGSSRGGDRGGGKRKWDSGGGSWDHDNRWSDWSSKSSRRSGSWSRGGGRSERSADRESGDRRGRGHHSEKTLDRQLDDYWGHDDDRY